MAGATPMAVLGQPTTLLVVQHRHTLPRARTQPPARQGWPHCGHPSIYPSPQTHQHGAAITQSCARSARESVSNRPVPGDHRQDLYARYGSLELSTAFPRVIRAFCCRGYVAEAPKACAECIDTDIGLPRSWLLAPSPPVAFTGLARQHSHAMGFSANGP